MMFWVFSVVGELKSCVTEGLFAGGFVGTSGED